MLPRAHFLLVFPMFIALNVTTPALAQVEPSATGSPGGALSDSEMMTPPPVSGMPYANTPGSEARSDYLAANVTFSPAYIDNILPGTGLTPISAVTYSIYPGVSFDRSTPRQQEQFSYSPTFTFYESTSNEPTSALDSVDQNASVSYQYRFNPEVAFSARDNFSKTSNVYNSSYLFSNTVTGATLTPTPTVIAPFAEQLMNTANGTISYQFGRNAMIGGGGSFITFDLPNSTDTTGLYSSNESAGDVFYNRRLTRAQYLGLTYQYARIVDNPSNGMSETQTQGLLPFYTFYFNQAFSISVSAGIEHVNTTATQSPAFNSWTPTVTASVGWQGSRGNGAGSFSRATTAGQGLLGAYEANTISGSGGWKFARTWSGGVSAGYTSIDSETPLTISSLQSGSTLTVSASVDHPINDHFSTRFQYQHLRENYSGIAVITADPDSNRESVTVTYQFSRPVGR